MNKRKRTIFIILLLISIIVITSFILFKKGKQDITNEEYAKVNEDYNSTATLATATPTTSVASSSQLSVSTPSATTEATTASITQSVLPIPETSNSQNAKDSTNKQDTPNTAINNSNNNQRKIETPSPSANIPENKSVNVEKAVTFTGYIIDQDCLVSYSDPSLETKGCLDMPECANSGYGIVTKEDGKYQFYVFDGKISSLKGGNRIQDATGGQQKAWDFIESSIEDKTIPVSVSGVLTGNSITLGGQTYKEIRVTSISEN